MRKELKILSVLALSLTGQLAFAQIKGKVQESDGLPSIGSKVEIKGTGTFTRTNDEGEFELSTAKVGDVLVITNLDDQKQEVKASDDLVFKFSAPLGAKKETEIDAVTIIGSIRMNPNEQIGAVSTIKSDDLRSVPQASVNEVLEGKVPNINFSGAGGQPGSANNITIRGINTFAGSSNPLYVIDGVPVGRGTDNSELLEGYASFNPLSGLDPNSIESITVLKDVSGTSLYGAQGANGVILIKTKSGKYNQKTKFSFTTETGSQDIAFDKHHWMTSEEYVQWGALTYAGYDYQKGDLQAYSKLSDYRSTFINKIGWDGITNEDWKKAVQRNSSIYNQYSFNASGGGQNTSFNIGASYYENKPLIKNSNFDRISANLGLNHKATDKLSFNLSANVSNVKTKTYSGGGSYSNPWISGWTILPIYPLYNEDGTYNIKNLGGNKYFNPVELLESDYLKADMTTFIGGVGMDYNFIKDFKFNSNFSIQNSNINERSWWNQFTGNSRGVGNLQLSNSRTFEYDWTNFVQFNKKIEKHEVTVDVGMDYQEHSRRVEYMSGKNFPEYITKPELAWASVFKSDGLKASWSQISYIARLAYTFDRKYTVTGNFRRDGNSTFGDDNQWGNFWNAGLLWNVSNESFLSSSKVINNLKFRASYGIAGNTPMTEWSKIFLHKQLYTPKTYSDHDQSGLYISSAGNKDLKWEQSEQFGIGVDFGLFNNRITGILDYYNRKTKDLITTVPITTSTGGPDLYYSNVGSIRNRGFELSITGIPIKNENFYWSVTASGSTNKSKVLKFDSGSSGSLNLIAYNKAMQVGKQAGEYYTWGWAGIDPNTGQGLWYTDETKSATTTNKDEAKRFFQGKTSLPIYQAALQNEISYKNFKLSFLFTGSFEYRVYDGYIGYWMSDGAYAGSRNQDRDLLYNSWTPDNPNADNPIQVYPNASKTNEPSSRFLRKGDHIRLKDVKFSYTFTKSFLGDIGIEDITIYVRGTNLITWAFDSKLKSDPDSYSSSANHDGYPDFYGKGYYDFSSPIMRTYSFGINVNF